MQLVVYIQCHRSGDGEMRLSLIRGIQDRMTAEILREKEERRKWAKVDRDMRRWEIEEETT